MANVVTSSSMMVAAAMVMILALMGQSSRVNAITCVDGIKAMMPCEAYLVGRGPDQPTQQCCFSVQSLYRSASSTADRRTLCQCFKDAASSYGIVARRAEMLPGLCHISIPVIISPTVDCTKIQ